MTLVDGGGCVDWRPCQVGVARMSRTTAADRAVSPIKAGAECPDVPVEMPDLRETPKNPQIAGKLLLTAGSAGHCYSGEGGGHRRLSYGSKERSRCQPAS